jgi:hypothetical protein
MMKEKGFLRIGESDDYYNPRDGVRVEDLHDQNVLVGENGRLFVIDPVAYLDARGKAERPVRARRTVSDPKRRFLATHVDSGSAAR